MQVIYIFFWTNSGGEIPTYFFIERKGPEVEPLQWALQQEVGKAEKRENTWEITTRDITILIQLERKLPKSIIPIVHGTKAEQLACQIHHNQSSTTTPPQNYVALWSPSNDLGGLTNRIGAKGEQGILTKMSPETTTSFELMEMPTEAHLDPAYCHPTPFDGRKPQRREGW
jgi:hypothetical protein